MDHKRIIDYLPAIYHEDKNLDVFLQIFGSIFFSNTNTDSSSSDFESIEGEINNLPYFHDVNWLDKEGKVDFIPWLGEWIAFSESIKASRDIKKKFISQGMEYYRYRGTKKNMKTLLALFLEKKEEDIEIEDNLNNKPYEFSVKVAGLADEQMKVMKMIIEAEKPAYTEYTIIN